MPNDSIWTAFEIYGLGTILPNHNNPELFERWLNNLWHLETQIMVTPGGVPVEGSNKYTDGNETWGNIRWPWKANTDNPEWRDRPREFTLDKHLKAIGSTGWNWNTKESWWLGYDFDALSDHARGAGMSDLVAVQDRAPDYCDVVRSTHGKGKHFYIFFSEPYPKTATHTEHAALARAMLTMMNNQSGFNFSTHLDVCGSILWLYHIDATPENKGFSLLQKAKHTLTAKDVPPNWKEHLTVVSGSRSKVRVVGWTPEGDTVGDELDELTSCELQQPLDEVHKRILDDLETTGHTCVWVHDHHLVQTHTMGLKKVHDTWKTNGHPMKGPFETESSGDDPGKPNCFMRPTVNGGWDVYRFGKGTPEHPLWSDKGDWTYCVFNMIPDLKQACLGANGIESPNEVEEYLFYTPDDIIKAIEYLSFRAELPKTNLDDRVFTLKSRKSDGKLVITITYNKLWDNTLETNKIFKGWDRKPKIWSRLLNLKPENSKNKAVSDFQSHDRLFRMTKTKIDCAGNNFEGWVLYDNDKAWTKHPKENIVFVLKGQGYAPAEVNQIVGNSILNPWTKVSVPFETEYPGGRVWNFGAPQWAYKPIDLTDDYPVHPHWDMVLNHCGEEWTPYLQELGWAKEMGILTGGDYLKFWVAFLLRKPFVKIPYIFLYGDENTGKTMLHEATAFLITNGVMKANSALSNRSDFNGELDGIVLAVMDEIDLSQEGKMVLNRIKDWTTSKKISIHAKHKQVYLKDNYLHFIQTSNEHSSVPITGRDTRLTAGEVSEIEKEIPRDELHQLLKNEAPHFMRTIVDLQLPKSTSRYGLPIIETKGKERVAESNQSALEFFLNDHCYFSPGDKVPFSDFYTRFEESLSGFERSHYTKTTIRRLLPTKYCVGKHSRVLQVGNMLFDEPESKNAFSYETSSGKLVQVTI